VLYKKSYYNIKCKNPKIYLMYDTYMRMHFRILDVRCASVIDYKGVFSLRVCKTY